MFLLTLLRDYGGLAATDHSRPPLSNKTSLTPRLCSTAGSKGIHFDLRRPDAWKNHCSVVRRAQHLRDQGVLRCTSRQSSPVWFHCLHRLHLMDHCYCIARVLQLRPDSDMTASLHFILETQRLRGHAGRVSQSQHVGGVRPGGNVWAITFPAWSRSHNSDRNPVRTAGKALSAEPLAMLSAGTKRQLRPS